MRRRDPGPVVGRRRSARVLGRWRITTLAASALTGLGLYLASRSETFVEQFADSWSPWIQGRLGVLLGGLGFSMAELVLAGCILYLATRACLGLLAMLRGRLRIRKALLAGGLRLLTLVAVSAVVFYGFWGVNYARRPLAGRLGWEAFGERALSSGELEALAARLVDVVNQLQVEVRGGPLAGPAPRRQAHVLDAALDAAYARVAPRLGLSGHFGEARGAAKPVMASGLMTWLGITGFYFPWTGEANYNRDPPGWTVVHAMAHEKAHQRAVTSEDEANFLGFLACAAAEDPWIRYCGYLFAQRQLLRALALMDGAAARRLIASRHPGVQADVDAVLAFWARHRGAGTRVGAAVNDSYLKLHRVRGGVASYGHSLALLVLWARSREGRITW